MEPIKATKALFIKLGAGGKWENKCFLEGTLRLDYHEVPHDLCALSDWDAVRASYPEDLNQGAVTRHIDQIKKFYEEPEKTLWITFSSNHLWWCFAKSGVLQLQDKSKTRTVAGQWQDSDINGKKLIKGHLSGKLLATQGFQGTICSVKEVGYLLHKINGTSEPHIAKAECALDSLVAALVPIIRNLHPKDLEILTDLIFRQGGWQRTGVAGEVEKDIDLDLISPITDERIAIQVKSKASLAVYQAYQSKFADMSGFVRFYFVTHSPDRGLRACLAGKGDEKFKLWGVEELAQQAAWNGLARWLIDKAS